MGRVSRTYDCGGTVCSAFGTVGSPGTSTTLQATTPQLVAGSLPVYPFTEKVLWEVSVGYSPTLPLSGLVGRCMECVCGWFCGFACCTTGHLKYGGQGGTCSSLVLPKVGDQGKQDPNLAGHCGSGEKYPHPRGDGISPGLFQPGVQGGPGP